MSFLSPVRLKYKGQISALHAASASNALWADLQHQQHQQRQSGDKVTEIADTTPQLEKSPAVAPQKKTNQPSQFLSSSCPNIHRCHVLEEIQVFLLKETAKKEDKLLYLWQKWSRPSVISPERLRGEDFLTWIQAIISH